MRRALAVSLLLLAALHAHADDYQQSLVKQFPFYNMSHGLFAPVYPALARQLVQDYGLTRGVCVDLGGADGALAIELAKITDLTVYVVDLSPAAVRLCNLAADQAGLAGRVRAVEGDATNLPLRDRFADLVISRNSLFEWPDQLAGVKEAYRILKPGGVAYLGGGFSRLLDEPTRAKLVKWSEEKRKQKPDSWVVMDDTLARQARAAGIAGARCLQGPTEFDWWLEFRRVSALSLSAAPAAAAGGKRR